MPWDQLFQDYPGGFPYSPTEPSAIYSQNKTRGYFARESLYFQGALSGGADFVTLHRQGVCAARLGACDLPM